MTWRQFFSRAVVYESALEGINRPLAYTRWQRVLVKLGWAEPEPSYICTDCGQIVALMWSGSHPIDDCPWLATPEARKLWEVALTEQRQRVRDYYWSRDPKSRWLMRVPK